MTIPPQQLVVLKHLQQQFPTIEAAVAEIARIEAVRTLPKGNIHVISDIHGEHQKLRHVINNASGTLRPLIERVFKDKISAQELRSFTTLIFYPAEVVEHLEKTMTDKTLIRQYARRTIELQLELLRTLVSRYSLRRAMRVFPQEYKELLNEMLSAPTTERGDGFFCAIIDTLVANGSALHMVHLIGRLIRNLTIYELVIGGDCWDRGPRGDKVLDYLRQQPNVSLIYGNHDAAWIGAALGHEALICHVLRVSLRYRRLAQIDEGYSIPLTPLEHLARQVYGNDPATQFYPKTTGTRPMDLVARMQKAVAIMQFKLEGQMISRNPQWAMEHRKLLHKLDHAAGTIDVDGHTYPLIDKHFPTIDRNDPYQLSPDEQECIDRMRHSFAASQKLQEHIRYMVDHGSMYLVRDEHLIFHGCVPCDDKGAFKTMPIDGQHLAGKPLFDAIDAAINRAVDKRDLRDLDLLWYLWSGPTSPLFGKDRIATLERDFIADKHPHHEEKDPYFAKIHEVGFCDNVLSEFGVDPSVGLIVNGHVPVKIEKGESPMKKSGKAITIDGAFSEAYGDHGYTLVLESNQTILARHHHFDSVEVAIRDGVDIVPSVEVIRQWNPPRRMADTERGRELKAMSELLALLIQAYRSNVLHQAQR
jgi:fructose-1,6-bisphosphatase III